MKESTTQPSNIETTRKEEQPGRLPLPEVLKLPVIQRGRVYIRAMDRLQAYATGEPPYTDKDVAKIRRSFASPTDRNVREELEWLYYDGMEYGKKLIGVQSEWGRVATGLLCLCIREYHRDTMATGATEMLRLGLFSKDFFDKVWSVSGQGPDIDTPKWNGEAYVFDTEQPGGLDEQIADKTQECKACIDMLKSAVSPLSQFLHSPLRLCNGEDVLPYDFLPKVIREVVDNPAFVEYSGIDYYKKWFADTIRARLAAGEQPTREEIRIARIPSYSEAQETEPYLENYSEFLRQKYHQFLPQ